MDRKNDEEEQQLFLDLFSEKDSGQGEEKVYEREEDALNELLLPDRETDAGVPGFDGDAEAAPPQETGCPSACPEESPNGEPGVSRAPHPLTRRILRRAALAFLAARKPDALASGIRTSITGILADAAAFSLGGNAVCHTTVALAAESAAHCVMPQGKRRKAEAMLRREQEKKDRLEQMIRETEPELNASLFPETAEWEYEKTRNGAYLRCLRKLEKLRAELACSGKLERLASESAADEFFLILPEGADFSGVPAEWGIAAVSPGTLAIREIRPSAPKNPAQEKTRNDLALQIAAAASGSVLFANGIAMRSGMPVLTRPPRKRLAEYSRQG